MDKNIDLAELVFKAGKQAVNLGVARDVALKAAGPGSSSMRLCASSFMRSFW